MILLDQPLQPRRASWNEMLYFLMAYCQLLVARLEALEQDVDPRTRPVPWSHFPDSPEGRESLFWMMYQGHVEQFRQVADAPDDDPVPVSVLTLCHSETSAFALTEAGAAFAVDFVEGALVPSDDETFEAAWNSLLLRRLIPHYRSDKRLFLWGQQVLKHFRQPARNQELLLCTAEELCWPYWFDDPLPRRGNCNPKVRLHDTIKDLNRRQEPYLIHFMGDGTGTRIGWSYR
jgi:hypothetical protein